MPLAQVVEVDALLSVVVASLVAGLGLVLAFSLSLACATRASELRRDGRRAGAVMLASIAAVALLGCLALVAVGLHVMITK